MPSRRVLRGGAFGCPETLVRCAQRFFSVPPTRNAGVGLGSADLRLSASLQQSRVGVSSRCRLGEGVSQKAT